MTNQLSAKVGGLLVVAAAAVYSRKRLHRAATAQETGVVRHDGRITTNR